MEDKISKISIIIPVYNAEQYLANVLKDLIEQTYENLQIIVVDDGSTDNSRDIIESFKQKDKRVCLISSTNRGPSSARNLGLEYADGEFIRFIDADDRIPLDSMENLIMPYIKDKDVDLVIGNYICTAEKNYYTGGLLEYEKQNDKEFAERFVKQVKTFYYGVPWNKLYRRDIINRYKIQFDESIRWCEDFLFNLEYYKQCRYISFVNCVQGVYEYYIRENGITVNLSEWSKSELRKIDELRYKKSLEYFAVYDLDEICRLVWHYSGLYYKLSQVAHKKRGRSFKERYEEFSVLLCSTDVYRYICIVQSDTNLVIWRFLKRVIEKKHFFLAFLVFVIKEYIAECMHSKAPFLRKYVKDKIPKFL